MLFNTFQYLIFLVVVVLLYYILPVKVRYIWLLIVSYYFYMQWNPLYLTLLFVCTLLTYAGGRIIEWLRVKTNGTEDEMLLLDCRKKQKRCLIVCIVLNLVILGFFKYLDFGIECLNSFLHFIHVHEISQTFNILLPVGISFYTLQALGYLIDVYRGDICAEKNFLRYALFVSFFPQLVAGPIERSQNLLVQLQEHHQLCYQNIRKGALLVLYGLFLKMVIADRAAIIVNAVYEDSTAYPGFYIIIATCFFAIQIYCDFYGYSTIARGSALIMGIHLMDNFNAPYYSKNVKEFWRRWHVSLSRWFRDYLYISLGGNRKGKVRKEENLLIVFAVSGLWHGASLSFILWGGLNGIYQVMADIAAGMKYVLINFYSKFMKRWLPCETNDDCIRPDCFSRRLAQTVFTFLLITFAWLFFRSGTLQTSYEILINMFSINNWTVLFDGSLYELGVERNYMNILLVSIVVLFAVDYYKYQGKDVAELLLQQEWWFRVLVIMLMLFTILLYGCYGEMYDIQQFIYFQF